MPRAKLPVAGSGTATMLGSLERQRAIFAWKCGGLDAADLTATVGTWSCPHGVTDAFPRAGPSRSLHLFGEPAPCGRGEPQYGACAVLLGVPDGDDLGGLADLNARRAAVAAVGGLPPPDLSHG